MIGGADLPGVIHSKGKIMRYFQCRLSQGTRRTIGWIEERGAKLGASVELPDLGGFWHVTKVSAFGIEAKALREKQSRDRNCLPSLMSA